MNNLAVVKAHWSFWLITLLALIWNLGGIINYLMQTNLELVANLPETHKAIIMGRPAWATGGFALGGFGGALGCLMLLFKKSASRYWFYASLVGIVITMLHTVNIAISSVNFTLAEIIIMIALPLLVAVSLIWFTLFAMRKHWVGRH